MSFYAFCGLKFRPNLNYYEDRKDVITNPVLLIEVLSKSTESYNRGEKFQKYRMLPSFKEYVLISQYKYIVETFYKESEKYWRINTAMGLHDSIYLHSVDCTITLKDLYQRVVGLQRGQTSIQFDKKNEGCFLNKGFVLRGVFKSLIMNHIRHIRFI